MSIKVQLKPTAILCVPFQVYDKDFSFIINGEEFKTSKMISDLLSPKICQLHLNDPIFNEFSINTKCRGHFSHVLELINFNQINFPENEVPFILEVLKILGNESIEIFDSDISVQITSDNVLKLIQKHEKYSILYSKQYKDEIEFIASHFGEIVKTQENELLKLDLNTIIEILNHDKMKLNSEDQLLKFINFLYRGDRKYSICMNSFIF